MIAFLRGQVLDKQPNRLIIDVQGVGYALHIPLSTYYNVGEPGTEVELRVYTHVREEALQLYGFLTTLEQEVFEHLIGVNGIGPKLALAVLSGMENAEFIVSCVQRGDVTQLTRIPGVGKKTAERIVLELKDRLTKLISTSDLAAPSASETKLRDDLISALLNLGYHRPLAQKAVDVVVNKGSDVGFEEALKSTLQELSH
jgi:Holliday junction DNA helicase RuvA